MPSLPLPGPLPLATITVPPAKPRAEPRNFSPTHLKLQARDPPVPPGLKQKLNQHASGTAATIKIHGFDVTTLTLPKAGSVGRARGVSLSTLNGKHAQEPLGKAQNLNSRLEVTPVTKAGGIGEKQARGANKWKRHTLARCERDRESVAEAAGAKHEPVECSAASVADIHILGGRPTRVPTRSPIPYVPPTAVPSHRPP